MGGIDLTDIGPAASACGAPCGAAAAGAAPCCSCLERRVGRRRFFLFSFSASSAADGGIGGGAGMGTAAVCSPVALMMQPPSLSLILSIYLSSKHTRRGNPRSGWGVLRFVDTDGGKKRGAEARGEEEEGAGRKG
nr:unnamed protein product [Digitaria exilis]CAB3451123.1 unnamed protein product [Digitaria exilis]CAB3504526.1 unnamed protein product [Digitaria exilis]